MTIETARVDIAISDSGLGLYLSMTDASKAPTTALMHWAQLSGLGRPGSSSIATYKRNIQWLLRGILKDPIVPWPDIKLHMRKDIRRKRDPNIRATRTFPGEHTLHAAAANIGQTIAGRFMQIPISVHLLLYCSVRIYVRRMRCIVINPTAKTFSTSEHFQLTYAIWIIYLGTFYVFSFLKCILLFLLFYIF